MRSFRVHVSITHAVNQLWRHRFVCQLCKLVTKCAFSPSGRCSYGTMTLLWVRQGYLKVEEGLEHFKRSLLSGMMQNRLCGNGQRAPGIKSKYDCALNGLILPERVSKVCMDSNLENAKSGHKVGNLTNVCCLKYFFFLFHKISQQLPVVVPPFSFTGLFHVTHISWLL